jgi:hypothetical protein
VERAARGQGYDKKRPAATVEGKRTSAPTTSEVLIDALATSVAQPPRHGAPLGERLKKGELKKRSAARAADEEWRRSDLLALYKHKISRPSGQAN